MANKTFWTAARIQLLRERFPTEEDLAQLAKDIGTSENACRCQACSKGIKRVSTQHCAPKKSITLHPTPWLTVHRCGG